MGLIGKLLLLAVIIGVVFFAFKTISRVKANQQNSVRDGSSRPRETKSRPGWARRIFKAEDLVECPRCGTFVRSLENHSCMGKA